MRAKWVLTFSSHVFIRSITVYNVGTNEKTLKYLLLLSIISLWYWIPNGLTFPFFVHAKTSELRTIFTQKIFMGVIVSKKSARDNSSPVSTNTRHSSMQRSQSETGESETSQSVRYLKLIFPWIYMIWFSLVKYGGHQKEM